MTEEVSCTMSERRPNLARLGHPAFEGETARKAGAEDDEQKKRNRGRVARTIARSMVRRQAAAGRRLLACCWVPGSSSMGLSVARIKFGEHSSREFLVTRKEKRGEGRREEGKKERKKGRDWRVSEISSQRHELHIP